MRASWATKCGFLLAATSFLIGARATTEVAANDAAADLALLQGRWRVVSWESDGRILPKEAIGIRIVEFSGGSFRWKGDSVSGTVALDASTRPKRVDYTDPRPDGSQGPVYHGIYRVNDETFRDCFATPGKPRPTRFGTRSGDGVTCGNYRRVNDDHASR